MSDTGAPGSLYIVSTPIGNMADITRRAVETLSSAALIVAEDTRHSRKLVDLHGIRTPVQAYHEHNEAKTTPRLVERLLAGDSIALITDAGTPLLSDPGARLVAAAIEAGVPVVPVPGASALLAALVASALPTDVFTFLGFLPRKGKERAGVLATIAGLQHTAVVYEAPGRVADTLADIAAAGAAKRDAVVARELTKKFEEFARGTVESLAAEFASSPRRGEMVILIAGASGEPTPPDEEALRAAAERFRGEGMNPREIAARLVDELGAARNAAYRIAHRG